MNNSTDNNASKDSEWLDTVPASRIASLLNSTIRPQDIDETAISRLRSSTRVGPVFKKILLSRLNKNSKTQSLIPGSANTASLNPAIQVLLSSPSSAENLAKIIGALIHGSSLRQLITKAEIESMQQWLGRDIYIFALRQLPNMPTNMVLSKPHQSLSQTIHNDGLSILTGWVNRQNEADRTKIELLHGDILTINALNEELEEKIGSVLSDSLVQEAVAAYKKLNA